MNEHHQHVADLVAGRSPPPDLSPAALAEWRKREIEFLTRINPLYVSAKEAPYILLAIAAGIGCILLFS